MIIPFMKINIFYDSHGITFVENIGKNQFFSVLLTIEYIHVTGDRLCISHSLLRPRSARVPSARDRKLHILIFMYINLRLII